MEASEQNAFSSETLSMEISDDVRKTAEQLYTSVLTDGYEIGRSRKALKASILYSSYRLQREPVICEKIASEYNVEKNKVIQGSKYIKRNAGLKFHPEDPENFIDILMERLELDEHEEQIESLSEKILRIVSDNSDFPIGKSPKSIAAAAIYSAGRLLNDVKLTQEEVSNISNVSKVTIRNTYQKQLEIYENTTVNTANAD